MLGWSLEGSVDWPLFTLGGCARQIKEKREVAKGTLLVIFDLLGREVDFKPGQYFWVTLLDPPYEDEKGPRRHITAVTSPNERGVLGLCTRLRESAFKRSLAELPIGAAVEVEEPKGNFLLPETRHGAAHGYPSPQHGAERERVSEGER